MLSHRQQTSSTSNQSPRLLYFISRNNGTIIPLIPADELPFNVRLKDLPRMITYDQTCGMQHVGTAPYTGLTFKLDYDATPTMHRSTSNPSQTHSRSLSSTTTSRQFLPPDALARQALGTAPPPPTSHPLPQRPISAHELSSSWRSTPSPTSAPQSHPEDKTQDVIDAIISTNSGAESAARLGYHSRSTATPPPSGTLPDPNKKEYCTYWIRFGECAFTQQGCMFKHEMPSSLEKLQELGLRRWPEWWQRRNQQVKFGAGAGTGGSGTKPAVWLSQRKGSESGSESDEEEGGEKEVRKKKAQVKTLLKPNVETAIETPPRRSSTTISSQQSDKKSRQQSLVGDLISFTSNSTSAQPATLSFEDSTTPSSLNSNSTTSTPTSPSAGASEKDPITTAAAAPRQPTKKIFVPAGESSEVHIADAKKRERAAAAAAKREERKGINGLMASKHATADTASAGENGRESRRGPGLRSCVPKPRVRAGKAEGDRVKGVVKLEGHGVKGTATEAKRP